MIPLTDRVFPGYVTYSADKENEVSKIFIIHVSLGEHINSNKLRILQAVKLPYNSTTTY